MRSAALGDVAYPREVPPDVDASARLVAAVSRQGPWTAPVRVRGSRRRRAVPPSSRASRSRRKTLPPRAGRSTMIALSSNASRFVAAPGRARIEGREDGWDRDGNFRSSVSDVVIEAAGDPWIFENRVPHILDDDHVPREENDARAPYAVRRRGRGERRVTPPATSFRARLLDSAPEQRVEDGRAGVMGDEVEPSSAPLYRRRLGDRPSRTTKRATASPRPPLSSVALSWTVRRAGSISPSPADRGRPPSGCEHSMRAEPLALVEQIKQSVGLLRRHL